MHTLTSPSPWTRTWTWTQREAIEREARSESPTMATTTTTTPDIKVVKEIQFFGNAKICMGITLTLGDRERVGGQAIFIGLGIGL